MTTPIAAFDFDNSFIDRDSLLPFLYFVHGHLKTWGQLSLLTPSFVRFLLNRLSRQEVKEKILTRFFRGWDYDNLEKWGKRYAAQKLDAFIKPQALQKLHWHQTQGHRCLIISASPDFYLRPWALRHGFEAVLASSLETTPQGVVTGRLKGLNCWGPEKCRRLLDHLGAEGQFLLYAYGDSRGDQDLLALAQYPFYRTF